MILRHLAAVVTFSGNAATFSGVATYNGATLATLLSIYTVVQYVVQLPTIGLTIQILQKKTTTTKNKQLLIIVKKEKNLPELKFT
jgi:hypothetical protein